MQRVKLPKSVIEIKHYTIQFQPPKCLKHNKHDLMKFWLLTYWSFKKIILIVWLADPPCNTNFVRRYCIVVVVVVIIIIIIIHK